MMNNPVGAQVGRFTNAHALPNSEDDNLWSTFDISVGHDDGFEVPSYEAVVEQLENQYGRLGSQHR
jgi:hypothetical protein